MLNEQTEFRAAQATETSYRGPLAPAIQIRVPKTEFVYEAVVELDQGFLKIGMGPLGERTIVPITGGKFAGPKINGDVLSGGADRQLVRADGALLLNAVYELKISRFTLISPSSSARQPGCGQLASVSHSWAGAPRLSSV